MCFSAPVSFGAAALIGAAGIGTLSAVKARREIPLAMVPVIFAVQQGIEGMLWLTVPQGHQAGTVWATSFALIALAIWPVLIPLAVGLAEKDKARRRLILLFLLPGLAASAYALVTIAQHPYRAWPDHHALTYINGNPYPPLMVALYGLAAALPPLLSTSRLIKLFGVAVVLGLAVSISLFFVSFVSVWCFFAALASAVLLAFFRKAGALPA